jgi:hypothetical protein
MSFTGKLGHAACLGLLLILTLPLLARAAAPLPFQTSYDAYYGDFSARANRSLALDSATGLYLLYSELKLEILGGTVTSVKERSEFRWANEQPLPQRYEYVQEGIGARERSVTFDHAAAQAEYRMNSTTGVLPLTGPVFDELSGYLLLQEQLMAGATDIDFDIVDRDRIKTVHYVLGEEEVLDTSLGKITTVKLERVRDDNSNRRTEIWLAPEYNYLLVRMVQEEPNSRVIRLELREAKLDGQPVAVRQPADP